MSYSNTEVCQHCQMPLMTGVPADHFYWCDTNGCPLKGVTLRPAALAVLKQWAMPAKPSPSLLVAIANVPMPPMNFGEALTIYNLIRTGVAKT